MSHGMYISALDWLGRGYHLLPVQPGTKKLYAGYGLHQTHIVDQHHAAEWFRGWKGISWNMAIVCPLRGFVLDFDRWDLYLDWVRFVKRFDDRITTSYTEITPHDGAHVFLSGDLPSGYAWLDGVEIKRVVLVAPSVVDRSDYTVMHDRGVYCGSLDAALFPLRKSFILSLTWQAVGAGRFAVRSSMPGSSVDVIKINVTICDLVKKYYPKLQLKGRGSFVSGPCPFHQDRQSSTHFWINIQKNIFGCHACKVRGDVINFYALVNHIDNNKAIKEMMAAFHD